MSVIRNGFCGIALAAGLWMIVAAGAGCSSRPERRVGTPCFSPDGSTLAYAMGQGRIVTWATIAGAIEQVAASEFAVRWRAADPPGPEREVAIGPRGAKWGSVDPDVRIALRFSPDSQHLAAVTSRGVTVIHLASGKHHQLARKGEFISSFAWLGNQTAVYAAHTWIWGMNGETSDRTFWRARIDQPVDRRVAIWREKAVQTNVSRTVDFGRTLEHWSPDGRYVIFASHELGRKVQKLGGRLKLLDSATGRVVAFGGSVFYHGPRVAWKSDGSAAFCLRDVCQPEGPTPWRVKYREALIVQTPGGGVIDVSGQFNRAFPVGINLGDGPHWTAEGEFLIVNYRYEGWLLCPQPWQLRPVGRRLTPPSHEGGSGSNLHPLPLPARLWGWDTTDRPCVLDYEGRRLCRLDIPRGFSPPRRYALSPNGRQIAELMDDLRVRVRPLEPPIPPPPDGTGATNRP